MTDREDYVFKAKLSEHAERYEEMVQFMKSIAAMNVELTVEERNLLSAAYKHAIESLRAPWRIISSMEQSEENDKRAEFMRQYKDKLEQELKDVCSDVLGVINTYLIPSTILGESKVFYYKLMGDYYRYMAEFTSGNERKQVAENALIAYKAACDVGLTELSATHPIRLGLALNFSVFYYEVLNSPDRACRLAKAAFDDAIAKLDLLSDESYKDSTLIMQLLRDNLTLWTADMIQNNGTKDVSQNGANGEELEEET